MLMFHGDGGIGTVTLLQKLANLQRQHFANAKLMGWLNVAPDDSTTPDVFPYRLWELCPAVPFPRFSLALAEYGSRCHREQVVGNGRQELLQGAGPGADGLAGGLKVLAQVPGLGRAINAMKTAAPLDGDPSQARPAHHPPAGAGLAGADRPGSQGLGGGGIRHHAGANLQAAIGLSSLSQRHRGASSRSGDGARPPGIRHLSACGCSPASVFRESARAPDHHRFATVRTRPIDAFPRRP